MTIEIEKCRYFLGTAQVRLRNLCYSPSRTEPDDCVGCCTSDLEHSLPALIGLSDYRDILSAVGLSEEALYGVGTSPKLTLPTTLELPCLHGKFRLETAKRDNSGGQDGWWFIDLYRSDTPITTLVQIRQLYTRHAPLGDGEKFLHIRFHERKKNDAVALKWKKLLGTKMKSFQQVIRNDWLRDSLEKLEPIRSLWKDLQLGSFPLILSWRCRQEIDCYLGQIYSFWSTIAGGDTHLIDECTIEKLGGLAPLWSSRDRSIIEGFFATSQVFPRVHDAAARAQILQKVLTIEGLILTFKTFFKHVKILGPVMLPLRELFPQEDLYPSRDQYNLVSGRLPSMRDILLPYYRQGPGRDEQQYLLQYSEQDERLFECSDSALYSYWQLCLFLLRNAQEPRNSSKRQRTQTKLPDCPGWIIRLGLFARRLGFESDRISFLCDQDPDLTQIRMHMLQERPSVLFFASAEKFEAEAQSRQIGQGIFEPRPPAPIPLMTTDGVTTTRVPRSHPELFLPTIWSALTQERRHALTEYGVLVLTCMSFFERFGSISASHTCMSFSERLGPTSASHTCMSISERSGSISASHAYQCAQPTRSLPRSSSVYSVPAYPDHLARSHGAHITLWHLPRSRNSSPTAEYSCDATKEDMKRVFNSIRAEGEAPLFALVDRDGRLKLCDPPQIMHRRKRSKQPKDVYYIYSNESPENWIMKKLDNYRP